MPQPTEAEWEMFNAVVQRQSTSCLSAEADVAGPLVMVPLPRIRFIVLEGSLVDRLLGGGALAPLPLRVAQTLARARATWPEVQVVVADTSARKSEVVRHVPALAAASWVDVPTHLATDFMVERGPKAKRKMRATGHTKRLSLLVFHAVATATGDARLAALVERAARGEEDDDAKSRLDRMMAVGGKILSLAAHTFSGRDEFENKHSGDIVCSGFGKLHLVVGCPYRCAYCYLIADEQMYRVPAFTRAYLNVEDAGTALRRFDARARAEGTSVTLNMGELCDTLAFEPVLQLLPPLLEVAASCTNVALAAVSKSGNALPLVPSGARGRVFDYRSISVTGANEHKTATPRDRANAGAASRSNGAVSRVRLDPPDVDDVRDPERYRAIVVQLLEHARPDRVIVGTPRFSERQLVAPARLLQQYVRGLEGAANAADDWSRTGPKARPNEEAARIAFYTAVFSIIREEAARLSIPIPELWVCKESPAVLAALALPPNGCCYDATAVGCGVKAADAFGEGVSLTAAEPAVSNQ